MSVITISREFGSLGTLVAEQAARALGYHLTDKATIAWAGTRPRVSTWSSTPARSPRNGLPG